jgi:RNA polymerase sigma factor (sigma-70 family)
MAEGDLEELAHLMKRVPAEERMTALLEAAAPVVTATVRRMVGDAHDTADVSQEALIHLFRRFDSWDPERGSFHAWVRAISRNVAIDHLRRRGRSRERLQNEVEADTPSYLARIEDAELIRSVYEELRARGDVAGRRALAAARDLAYLGQDLSIAAIAREAELTESTTRRALDRVRLLVERFEKG